MGTQKKENYSKCHYFVTNSFSNEPKNKKKTFQQNMNNSDLSSRLIKAQFIMSHTYDSV